MKMEMTELGPVTRALKIEVSEEAVNKEFQRAYAELKRQVRVPGFRPGKAPVALLEKRYAQAVEQDVVQRLVPDYYDRAVKEAGVVPIVVDIPPLERMKIKRDASFTFTATIEIKPTIELRDYRPPNPISLKPDQRVVTEEQIEQALQTLREQHAQIDAAPDGASLEEGMYAILSIEGFLDAEPVEGTKKVGHLHQVGSHKPILGLEMDEQLVGHRVGDQIEIPQAYPVNHPDGRLAGKTVLFRVTVDAVKQRILPALDDEFAKDCGEYETLEDLRTVMKNKLDEALKRDIEDGYKEQIMERLLQMHHFDIPEPLVERELRTMIRQKMIRERGVRQETADLDEPLKVQEETKRLQQEFQPEATRRVKFSLILEAIAAQEGLVVEPEEIEVEMNKVAGALKLSIEEVRRMVDAGGQPSRDEFRGRILAEKALQLVYQFAVIQG